MDDGAAASSQRQSRGLMQEKSGLLIGLCTRVAAAVRQIMVALMRLMTSVYRDL